MLKRLKPPFAPSIHLRPFSAPLSLKCHLLLFSPSPRPLPFPLPPPLPPLLHLLLIMSFFALIGRCLIVLFTIPPFNRRWSLRVRTMDLYPKKRFRCSSVV